MFIVCEMSALLKVLLVSLALVTTVLSARIDVRLGEDKSPGIRALHHNPHWECFERDPGASCTSGQRSLFKRLLRDYDIDFASLIMGGEFVAPTGYATEHHWSHQDRAQLLWNTQRWTKEETIGTMFMKGRAGIIGRFSSRTSPGLKVVVASFHYAHSSAYKLSKGAEKVGQIISEMSQGTRKVLILADTNVAAKSPTGKDKKGRINEKPSVVLLGEFGLGGVPHTTRALPTCCADDRFANSYDRIFSNFGKDMRTIEDDAYLKLTKNLTVVPSWAAEVTKLSGDIAAYHHPVLAELTL